MGTFERVADLVADLFSTTTDCITEDTNFKFDLGADDLDDIEIILAAEEEFGISIPDEEAATVETVGDLVHIIDSKF